VGLPTSSGNPSQHPQCVALDQAREAVAIWLAITATHTSPAQLGYHSQGGGAFTFEQGENTAVAAWTYPGENTPYLASPGPQTTAAGYLLAKTMTSLPAQKVSQVLHAGWAQWSNWHTTDAQLAAALGIPAPAVPAPNLSPRTGQSVSVPPPSNLSSQPVCTT
jgi:hypothetical protein